MTRCGVTLQQFQAQPNSELRLATRTKSTLPGDIDLFQNRRVQVGLQDTKKDINLKSPVAEAPNPEDAPDIVPKKDINLKNPVAEAPYPEDAPDVVILISGEQAYELHFVPFTIGDGILLVGHLRRHAAKTLGIDPKRLGLSCRWELLEEDHRPAKYYGITHNSAVTPCWRYGNDQKIASSSFESGPILAVEAEGAATERRDIKFHSIGRERRFHGASSDHEPLSSTPGDVSIGLPQVDTKNQTLAKALPTQMLSSFHTPILSHAVKHLDKSFTADSPNEKTVLEGIQSARTLSDQTYDLCFPILEDKELENEDKTDKLEELLRKEASLTGRPLENAVLDALRRHRNATKDDNINNEAGVASTERKAEQLARLAPKPSSEDFRNNECFQPDMAPLEHLQLSMVGSNSGTDISAIDSDSERSFVTNTAAAPRTTSIDTEALLEFMGRSLAPKVLEGFFDTFPRTTSATADNISIDEASRRDIAAPVPNSKSLQARGSAAKRSADQRNDDEDADEDDRGNTKRQRQEASSIGSSKLLLACLYFKMDPVRYSERNQQEQCYRGCASSVLRNIPRLKQHLYRVHRRPEYYCGRCYVTFDTQALADIHSRQSQSCTLSEPQFQEKMDNDQMSAIKRRNRRVNAPAEWYSMFKILFPDASLPASPYADHGSSEIVQNFTSYFRREAPSVLSDLVRSELSGRVFLDDQTQEILDVAFESAVSQLVLRFEARLENVDSLPQTGEQALGENATDSTTSLNRLTPRSDAGVAAQGILGDVSVTDPNDLLFDIASDSWLDPNFFD